MRKGFIFMAALVLLLTCAFACAQSSSSETVWTAKLTAHCATVEEGQEAMRNRTLFHNQINARSLDYLLQRKGGTVEDYIEYSVRQVLPFTPEKEQRVYDVMEWLNQQLESHGLKLPDPGPITFVKSTGKEAMGATGYTSEGVIFLKEEMYSTSYAPDDHFRLVVAHELSHCLSRMFPEYRQTLYSLIHFTVLDHDIEIPEEIFSQVVANPDVEHHNSYATFTIRGEKKDCYLVTMIDRAFEQEGDSYIYGMYPAMIPLNSTTVYRKDDVDDFWEIFGRNTTYVIDPEEASANHFAYALLRLDDGYGEYSNPEILEGVIDYLKR